MAHRSSKPFQTASRAVMYSYNSLVMLQSISNRLTGPVRRSINFIRRLLGAKFYSLFLQLLLLLAFCDWQNFTKAMTLSVQTQHTAPVTKFSTSMLDCEPYYIPSGQVAFFKRRERAQLLFKLVTNLFSTSLLQQYEIQISNDPYGMARWISTMYMGMVDNTQRGQVSGVEKKGDGIWHA